MGTTKINRELFNKIKLDLKTMKKKAVCEKYKLSHETIRLVNKASSFRSWESHKRIVSLKRVKSLKEYNLEFEEHSNWFTSKLKWFKR